MGAVDVPVVVAVVVAAAAALRGTWSPCGLSMLSTITPLAEAGRGHRYRWTAGWYFIGAVLGGATTGLVAAALAAGMRAMGPGRATATAVATAAALVAAGMDSGLVGPPLPHHRRQVDEDWLGRYRPWAYGIGFGWQIGTGVGTYIMTAAVYLVIVLGALSGSPATAFGLCVVFGACRGSTVLLGARLTTADRLRSCHARFEAWREPVRRGVVVVELLAAAVLASVGGVPSALALTATAAVTVAVALSRGGHRSPAGDSCSVPVGTRS